MTDRPDFERIGQIIDAATVDESELADVVSAAGNSLDNLRLLVNHFASAAHWRVLGYIALAMSRIAWQRGAADDRLAAVLSDFMATARTTYHPGTLISTLNALQGLVVNWSPARQHKLLHNLSEFVLACLNHPDLSVRSNAVAVLCQLWEAGLLTKCSLTTGQVDLPVGWLTWR